MTEKIQITIEDLDDIQKVLIALDNLFRTLLNHYIDTEWNKLSLVVVSCSVYFGRLHQLIGCKEK
jgi:hypothetical protein